MNSYWILTAKRNSDRTYYTMMRYRDSGNVEYAVSGWWIPNLEIATRLCDILNGGWKDVNKGYWAVSEWQEDSETPARGFGVFRLIQPRAARWEHNREYAVQYITRFDTAAKLAYVLNREENKDAI